MGCIRFIGEYLLYGINAIVTFVSLVVILSGSVVLYFSDEILGDQASQLLFVPILIVVSGCVLFFIASFGCCGSIAKSPCLLITYAICLLIIMATSIYVVVLVSRTKELEAMVQRSMQNLFEDKNMREPFNLLEVVFQCCGTTGPDAYINLNLDIPITCCPVLSIDQITGGINNITDSINNITDIINNNSTEVVLCTEEDASGGCSAIFVDFIISSVDVVFYFLIAVLVFQAVGIIIATGLAYRFWSQNKKKNSGDTIEVLLGTSVRDQQPDYTSISTIRDQRPQYGSPLRGQQVLPSPAIRNQRSLHNPYIRNQQPHYYND